MSRKSAIIEGFFDAYRTKNRKFVEDHLTEDFRFTSPYDDGIDKAEYFERCWPNSDRIERHRIEKILEDDGGAFVTYTCRVKDGREFRNTEYLTFEGDRLSKVDVYFGAAYRDGEFLPQQ
jgi:hypothetical protein